MYIAARATRMVSQVMFVVGGVVAAASYGLGGGEFQTGAQGLLYNFLTFIGAMSAGNLAPPARQHIVGTINTCRLRQAGTRAPLQDCHGEPPPDLQGVLCCFA